MPALPHRAGFLACFLLLTACVSAPALKAPVAVTAPREPDAVQHVLDYQGWLSLQTAESMAVENSRLEQAGTPRALLEKALLRASSHELPALEEALAMLASLQASPDPAAVSLKPLARLLTSAWQADVQEQKRQLEQQERLAQQLRDSQRRNEQLSDRVEQLGHKLEALKSIELNLPKPAGSAPPASLPNPAPATVPGPATRSPAS